MSWVLRATRKPAKARTTPAAWLAGTLLSPRKPRSSLSVTTRRQRHPFDSDLYTEELRSRGTFEAEIKADIAKGYKEGRFKAPSKPGVLYMLSSDNRLGPTPERGTAPVPPHFMFYAPYITKKDLGFAAVVPFLTKPGEPDAKIVVFPDPNMK